MTKLWRSMPLLCWYGCALLLVMPVVGCQAAESDHEAEHIIPAHKPRDYRACVAQLRALHGELLAGPARPEDSLAVHTELTDLIRWLPELAAETELDEVAWNQVVQQAEQMAGVVHPLAELPRSQQGVRYIQLASQIEKSVSELARIADLLPPPPPKHETEIEETHQVEFAEAEPAHFVQPGESPSSNTSSTTLPATYQK